MYIIYWEVILYYIFWNIEMIKYLLWKLIDIVFMNVLFGYLGVIIIRVILYLSLMLFIYYCGLLILFKILVFRCDKVIFYIFFVLFYRFEYWIYSFLLIFKKNIICID